MAENPTLPTTDQPAAVADKTVGAVVDTAEVLAEDAIIAAEPVMGTPVLKQIWESFLKWVFRLISKGLGTVAGYAVIDVQKLNALTNAASALAHLKAAQASGDPNAIKKANDDTDAAVAPILHYIGDFHP